MLSPFISCAAEWQRAESILNSADRAIRHSEADFLAEESAFPHPEWHHNGCLAKFTRAKSRSFAELIMSLFAALRAVRKRKGERAQDDMRAG
jgi:hypothetical protein